MHSRISEYTINRLTSTDIDLLVRMTGMFGREFGEMDLYGGRPPGSAYLGKLLSDDAFIAVVAEQDNEVVGGLVAYEFRKFERQASELYIYDLAVVEAHRRRGIASALIEEVGLIAREKGVTVMYVQAEDDNDAAIGLYSRLGSHERIHHFDIPVKPGAGKQSE